MVSNDGDNNRLRLINRRNTLVGTTIRAHGRANVAVKKAMFVASAAVDSYHIVKAIHTDCTTKRNRLPGKRTIKTSASVGGSWTFGTLGAAAGTGVGTLFGGIGAVPGGIIGEIIGSHIGSYTAEKIVDNFVSSESEGESEDED